jgi:hypothetical protein
MLPLSSVRNYNDFQSLHIMLLKYPSKNAIILVPRRTWAVGTSCGLYKEEHFCSFTSPLKELKIRCEINETRLHMITAVEYMFFSEWFFL